LAINLLRCLGGIVAVIREYKESGIETSTFIEMPPNQIRGFVSAEVLSNDRNHWGGVRGINPHHRIQVAPEDSSMT
jgi:hypothetical protein